MHVVTHCDVLLTQASTRRKSRGNKDAHDDSEGGGEDEGMDGQELEHMRDREAATVEDLLS